MYRFNVLLELETIDPMATVPATRQLMVIKELNFQKEPWRVKLELYLATDTVIATI